MSLEERLFAAIYDPFMARTEAACLQRWRRALLADVEGVVLEVGAGTGANLALYGSGVTELVLTEPEPAMRRRLEHKLVARGGRAGARIAGADAERLRFADASFDVVVSMLVLCTVPDPALALAEMSRVLRPGGRLVFLEHVLSPEDAARARWQRRIDPIWRRIAGGCRLTRRTDETIRAAGLPIESLTRESMQKALPWIRPTIRGVARKP